MAITINGGTGVITGISVGGLPDGVVDAGTLATNSVDSAELIDGAVDNSHLATGMDAGKLINALPAISGASLTGITTGSWEYMSTSTTGSSRAFENVFSFYSASPNWPAYMFVMDLAMDNAGGGLGIRFYNSSDTLVTSGYQWNCATLHSNASTWTIGNSNSDTHIKCSTLPSNAAPLWCTVIVRYANGRTVVEADTMWNHTHGSNYFARSIAGGMLYNSDEPDGIQFTMHSGIFQGGDIHAYRLNDS